MKNETASVAPSRRGSPTPLRSPIKATGGEGRCLEGEKKEEEEEECNRSRELLICELQNKQCINGGRLLCDQLLHNALQRCFAIWPQPAAVGGPFLTDGRTNLLISPTIAEAG